MKLFDSVTFILMFSCLYQSQLWLSFFFTHKSLLHEEEEEKQQYQACFKPKPQVVALISANNTSHAFFVLTFFDLKSFEETWHSMLRGLSDADPRGYMLNCLGVSVKMCSSLFMLFLTWSCAWSNVEVRFWKEWYCGTNISGFDGKMWMLSVHRVIGWCCKLTVPYLFCGMGALGEVYMWLLTLTVGLWSTVKGGHHIHIQFFCAETRF